jgi:hypothetical protein
MPRTGTGALDLNDIGAGIANLHGGVRPGKGLG